MGLLPTRPERRVSLSWIRYTSRGPSFAAALSAEHYFIQHGEPWGFLKYIARTLVSLAILLRRRPSLVIAMNPPLFAPLLAWLYCRLFDADYVMDSHSGAFNNPVWARFRRLHRFLSRRALFCVVHNEVIHAQLREFGARGVVVSDIACDLEQGHYPLADGIHVAVVSQYSFDEPLDAVWEAARRMPHVTFHVTGNDKKAPRALLESRPGNVVLTGFLPAADYGALMAHATVIVALTTRDNTMQRGGSEAISVGRPLVTSDWALLREAYRDGAVYCDNSPGGIQTAIDEVLHNLPRHEQGIAALRAARDARWHATLAQIEALLSEGGRALTR